MTFSQTNSMGAIFRGSCFWIPRKIKLTKIKSKIAISQNLEHRNSNHMFAVYDYNILLIILT